MGSSHLNENEFKDLFVALRESEYKQYYIIGSFISFIIFVYCLNTS